MIFKFKPLRALFNEDDISQAGLTSLSRNPIMIGGLLITSSCQDSRILGLPDLRVL